jgi:hypothetical protein
MQARIVGSGVESSTVFDGFRQIGGEYGTFYGSRRLARTMMKDTSEVSLTQLGFHVIFRSDDDRVLAPSPQLRRALARSVYRVARGFPLTAFGAADNHLHTEVLVDRSDAGRFAHALMCSLRWSLDISVEFAPVRYKALADQGHKRSTFHYALGQRNHHGVQSDPFMDASSLPELLGMRLLPTDSIALVREHFPRLQRRELLRHLGLDDLHPADDEQLRRLVEQERFDLLRDAAAGAVAAPALEGRQPQVAAARAALVQVLQRCCRPGEIAAVVERSSSRVRFLRGCELPEPLVRAVRLQLHQRAWLLERHPDLVDRAPTRLPDLGVPPDHQR